MPERRDQNETRDQAPPRPCSICGKPSEPRWRPFCSKRCADVDLGRWLGEGYAIPGEPADVSPPPDRDEVD